MAPLSWILPFNTWTTTEWFLALEGAQVYNPASELVTFLISRVETWSVLFLPMKTTVTTVTLEADKKRLPYSTSLSLSLSCPCRSHALGQQLHGADEVVLVDRLWRGRVNDHLWTVSIVNNVVVLVPVDERILRSNLYIQVSKEHLTKRQRKVAPSSSPLDKRAAMSTPPWRGAPSCPQWRPPSLWMNQESQQPQAVIIYSGNFWKVRAKSNRKVDFVCGLLINYSFQSSPHSPRTIRSTGFFIFFSMSSWWDTWHS